MTYRRYYREFYGYSSTGPKKVKGGIKSQSKRGKFVSQWWGKRWIEVLEGFNIGARLARGKSYARKGQVADLKIEEGQICARVQGSRSGAYKVLIQMKTLTRVQWQKVAEFLSEQPIFAAKLLAGEMPEEIEAAFRTVKLSLFPKSRGDLSTDCSCPDWSNPCKHIAAVYYILGEAFDHDPFLLFKLRGIDRETLFNLMGGEESLAEKAHQSEAAQLPQEPLPENPENFWGTFNSETINFEELRQPPVAGTLLKRLGKFPFWRGTDNFQDTLIPLYEEVSAATLDFLSCYTFADRGITSGIVTNEDGEIKSATAFKKKS